MTEKKNGPREKRTFSALDLLLVLLAALAVSLAVYFWLETPYGRHSGDRPVYRLTVEKPLEEWELEQMSIPEERQRLLDEQGNPAGRVLTASVILQNGRKTLVVTCEWEGERPDELFHLETANLVKTMHVTEIEEMTEDGK